MSDLEETLEKELVAEEAGQRAKIFGIAGLVAGVLGLVVGIAGVVMAQGAQKSVEQLRAELAAKPDNTEEFTAALGDLEERLVRLGGELVKLTRADRDLQQNVQNALAGSSREIAANRTALQEVVGKVNEMGERMEQLRSAPVAAARPAAAAGAAAGESEESAPAEAGIHVIASGDTLSKIAQQYGVSLTQLQRANPTVNPRALQIGQRIVIPQP